MSDQPQPQQQQNKEEELFQDLTFKADNSKKTTESDDDVHGPMEIESLCMNCHENGITRLLLIKVPHFRELILMSFQCDHCGNREDEIQFGGVFAEKGIHFEWKIKDSKDLNRQIVKSDWATLSIPELGFEIPAQTQKGSLNTLEGVLLRAIEGISQDQPERKAVVPEVYEKLEEIIQKLTKCRDWNFSEEELAQQNGVAFTIILDDPSGNSNLENPFMPNPDPNVSVSYYMRTREQNRMLGLGLTEEDDDTDGPKPAAASSDNTKDLIQERDRLKQQLIEQQKQFKEGGGGAPKKAPAGASLLTGTEAQRFEERLHVARPEDILVFPEQCYNCDTMGTLKVVPCMIPHFKEIVLMAFSCDHCGWRNNEVKAGGPIADKGRRISLVCTSDEDLARDFLKADTASIEVPELGVKITEGSLGGRFTTVEGILRALKDQLESIGHFNLGDSTESIPKDTYRQFLDKLGQCADGKIMPFTIIVDDPLANSYIQNIYAPDPDPNMTIEDYERSWQQNEDFGLNDMHV